MEARIMVIFMIFLGNAILCQGYIFDEVEISNGLSSSETGSQESNVEAELLQEALHKIASFKESFECPPEFTYKECFEIALKIVSKIIEDTFERSANPQQEDALEFRKPKIPVSLSHPEPESKVIQEVQEKLATFKESFNCPPAFTYKECFQFALNITSSIIDDAIERSVNQPPLVDIVKEEKNKIPTFPWWPSFDHDSNEDEHQIVEAFDDPDTDKEFIMQMGIHEDKGRLALRSEYDKPFYCRCRDGDQGHGHFNCRCRPIIDQPLKFTSISSGHHRGDA